MINVIPTLTVMNTIKEYENMIDNFIKSQSKYFRCNATRFSNEIYQESLTVLQKIYKEKTGEKFKLILDIPCPKDKHRVEFLREKNQFLVRKNEILRVFYREKQLLNKNDLYIKLPQKSYKKGEKIIIGDGDVVLKVICVKNRYLECRVEYDGEIGYRKACYIGEDYCHNLEKKEIYRFLDLIKALLPEYVALSFVENELEVVFFKKELEKRNIDVKIISKIESKKALERLQNIIRVSDKILIGRGDLALASGYGKLAGYQEEIITICKEEGCEVLVATDIVNSLCYKAFPSRAEVCDVYNLIKQGVYNFILSGPLCRYNQYNVAIDLLREIENTIK